MNAASDNFRPSVTQLESQMLKRQREAAVTSWPVSNAIISPIMARNAAAALKPGSSQSSADNGEENDLLCHYLHSTYILTQRLSTPIACE